MKELIKIVEHDNRKIVDARELHKYLGSKQDFSTWIKSRIDKYGFVENQDYISFHKIVERENGGTTRIEYGLTMNMAKEISMIENNEKGRQARKYFIACETLAKEKQVAAPTRRQLAEWVIETEKENKILKPKAELMDRVIDSDKMIDVGQAAKILGLPFGRNTLFSKLRERGIFFKNKNEPKQQYVDAGYFHLKEKLIEIKNGELRVFLKVLITQRGLAFTAKIFDAKIPSKKLMIIK